VVRRFDAGTIAQMAPRTFVVAILLSTPHPSPSATPSPLRGEGARHDNQVDSTAQALAWAKQRPAEPGIIGYWRRLAEEG